MSARVLGMGGAFTGLADDSAALIYNPAGLAWRSDVNIKAWAGAKARNLFEVRDDLEMGEIFHDEKPPKKMTEALPDDVDSALDGSAVLSLGTTAAGAEIIEFVHGRTEAPGGEADKYELAYNQMRNLRFGLGDRIISVPAEVGTALYGLNIRYTTMEMESCRIQDPSDEEAEKVIYERSGAGFALDGGLLIQLTPNIHMGALVENILARDVELESSNKFFRYERADNETENEDTDDGEGSWDPIEDGTEDDSSDEISPSRRGRIGFNARLPALNTEVLLDVDNVPLLTEGDTDAKIYAGLENELMTEVLKVRAGTYRDGFSGDKNEYRVFTGGLGLNLTIFEADLGLGWAPQNDIKMARVEIGLGF